MVGRLAFWRISALVLIHTNGWQRAFQPVTKARIFLLSSATEATSARCKAWRSMIPNHTSTRFSYDAEVGVKCAWNLGLAASHAFTSGVLGPAAADHDGVRNHQVLYQHRL